MKENQERISNDRKPLGMPSVTQSLTNSSARENSQHKGGEKKKPKPDRLSRTAGQRKGTT